MFVQFSSRYEALYHSRRLTLLLAALANAERSPSLLSYSFLFVSLMIFEDKQDSYAFKHVVF